MSSPNVNPRVLEAALRGEVHRIYVKGNLEELTVKRVRLAVEREQELKDGFFKQSQWRDKSKTIIEHEATVQERLAKAPPKLGPDPKKRKTPAEHQTPKRQKLDAAPSSTSKVRPRAEPEASSSSELSKVENYTTNPISGSKDKAQDAPTAGSVSESELSELIDEEPKPKRVPKKSGGEKKQAKESKSKAAKKEPPDMDPDTAEIKRLQGWLSKCGIRKMWARELKPYDSPKAKIRHLRDMLADVGMTGRFSAEKASQIRETRELQADLEAVQEGNKYWGKKENDSEEEVGARPKQRLARGLQELAAFGDSESD